MKRIKEFEDLCKKYKDIELVGITNEFYNAYEEVKITKNKILNFGCKLFVNRVADIIQNCKQFNITEITISSNEYGTIDAIGKFEELGCKLIGLTKYRTFASALEDDVEMKYALKIKIN